MIYNMWEIGKKGKAVNPIRCLFLLLHLLLHKPFRELLSWWIKYRSHSHFGPSQEVLFFKWVKMFFPELSLAAFLLLLIQRIQQNHSLNNYI